MLTGARDLKLIYLFTYLFIYLFISKIQQKYNVSRKREVAK